MSYTILKFLKLLHLSQDVILSVVCIKSVVAPFKVHWQCSGKIFSNREQGTVFMANLQWRNPDVFVLIF